MLPKEKARMRNSDRLNIGRSTWRSMTTNTPSRMTPPMRPASTFGLVHPMVWPP